MVFLFRFLPYLFLIGLLSCTSPGGLSENSSPGTPATEVIAPVQSLDGADESDSSMGAGTPTRPGIAIALDPHDEFFPVLVPDQGGPYILEECFQLPPEEPQCKYLTVPCAELPGYTIEEHPEKPNICRIHEWIMIWGFCGFLDQCNKALEIQEPCPPSLTPCIPDLIPRRPILNFPQ